MISTDFNPKKTKKLFGYTNEFEFLKKLVITKSFPRSLLLTGSKGEGKSTIVNHLMYYYFDNKNYDKDKNIILSKSNFYNQFVENQFPNIIYLSGSDFKNVRIDDIRKIRVILNKTPIINDRRFIILDDVEKFNINSLNALLKIIEEPGSSNFFILINNKSKFLIDTIKSRSIEVKIILNNKNRNLISRSLINHFNQEKIFDENLLKISPGNYLKFNSIFYENNFDINDKFSVNFNNILKLYKKEKDMFYKELLLFFVDYNFQKIISKKILNNRMILQNRSLMFKNINNFFLYNLSQNTLINSVENYFLDE